MHLDSSSVILAGSAVLILQGVAYFYFWWRDRTAPWLLWWATSFAVGGAAVMLYATPHWSTDILNIAGGNLLRILSMWGLWQGVRLFEGRPVRVWPAFAVAIGWLAVVSIPALGDSLIVRIVLASLLVGLFCALSGWELRGPDANALPSRRTLMAIFFTFAIVMLIRGALGAIAPFPVGALPADPIWLAGFTVVIFAHFVFAASLFLAMTRERREAEQRSFAMSDPLTGLMNRRAFSDFAERMNRRHAGLRQSMAVLVLDLDHFKLVNDRFGHEAGDRLLKVFADVTETNARATDGLFRMGGEEFCCVLPDTTLEEAITVAERMRVAFAETGVETASGRASATVSIGIAGSSHDATIESLLAAADAAVYEAKARGRNRVIVAPDMAFTDAAPEPLAFHKRRA